MAAAIAAAGAPKPSGAVGPIDSKATSKRLQQELMQLMMSGNKDVSAFPDGDNLFRWAATVKGGAGTAYEGMTFKLRMEFPAEYPYKAPAVFFSTACYHPNVDLATGTICLDILKDKWTAAYSVLTVLLSLQSLLGEPNNESPLNAAAAGQWVADIVEFRRIAVRKYRDSAGANPTSGWGAAGEA